MSKNAYAVGDRVDKLCVVCEAERGHVVASVTKRGSVSRVTCPACGTRSSFKSSSETKTRAATQTSAPYDPTRMYRTGQMMMHPSFGLGEVTAVLGAQKIDVLFADRLRRMIHGRTL